MEEKQEEIVVNDVVVVDEIEKAEVDETTKVEPDADEAEARRMGWLPEAEYKGDKSRWRDAKTFLERGKNELPILRERWKKADAEIAELKKTLKEVAEYQSKVEKVAYERAVKDLKAQQEAAVLSQDVEAFRKLDGDIDKLRDSIPKPPKVEFTEQDDSEEKEWLDKNPWAKNKEMYSFAYSVGELLRKAGNTNTGMDFYDDIAAEVKRLKPEKFTNKRRTEAPAVEGNTGVIRGKGKSFADLDADTKATADRFVKQGLFKTREEYAKKYFELEGE